MTDSLKLDPKNSRKHQPRNQKAISDSLKSVGAFRSIGAVRGTVKVGNGVYQEAQKLGYEIVHVKAQPNQLVCVDRDDMTDEQADSAAVLDNLAADSSYADYDYTLLAEQLAHDPIAAAIAKDDARIAAELEKVNPPKQEPQDPGELVDKAAQLQEKWQVQRGDLWQCGKHRILCGDSTNADDVARVMGGEKAQLLASDPPYNVGKDYGEEVDDKKVELEYETFSRLWFGNWQAVSVAQIVTPGCNNLARWLRYFDPYHVAPWVKTNSMTNGKVARWWCWEPVLFFGDKWNRKRPNDVFDYPIGQQKEVANHPCPKPLKMWVDLIENYTEQGAIVCDAFNGSGTTVVACQQTGRIGRAIELEPQWVSVALERLSLLGLSPQRLAP